MTVTKRAFNINMPVNQLPNEMQLMFNVCRSLCKRELIRPYEELLNEKLNWNEVIQLANHHGLTPILYATLKQLSRNIIVPEKILNDLRAGYYQTVQFNIRLFRMLNLILNAFKKNGLSIILLKGPALIADKIYPNMALRQMSDIDILIKKEDADKVHKVLNELGYQCEPVRKWLLLEYYCLEYYHLEGIKLEIHWELFMPEDFQQTFVSLSSAVLWNHSKQISIDSNRELILSDEVTLLYLCLHYAKHFRRGEFRLIWSLDVALFLEKKDELIDWSRFWKLTENSGLYELMCEVLASVNESIARVGRISKLNIKSNFANLKSTDKEGKIELHSIIFLHRILKIQGLYPKVITLIEYIFPNNEVLVWRYNVKNTRKLTLRRLFHPLFLIRKAALEIVQIYLKK